MHIIQPPIISQVCSESRRIVLKSGEMLQDVCGQTKQWIDTKHDRIAWWWIPDLYKTLLSSFVLHAQHSNKEPVIMARGAYPFRLTVQETDYLDLEDVDIAKLYELKSFFLCIKVVRVHTNRPQAIQSRLWGTTGEEVSQLVEPHDTIQIQKFRREMNGEDQEELEFVDSVLNKEEFAAEIAEWELGIKSHWLWVEWIKAFLLARINIGEKTDIWLRPRVEHDGRSWECFFGLSPVNLPPVIATCITFRLIQIDTHRIWSTHGSNRLSRQCQHSSQFSCLINV
ncbi:hypothetical protein N7540_006799 [Penicillium herquei]|nr:hypothetical protein N7540_006799 [Penicillium herquei]